MPVQPADFSRPLPWEHDRGLAAVLQNWRRDPRILKQMVLDQTQAATCAVVEPLPSDLHVDIAKALQQRGIERLYAHQAEAYVLAREKKDFVVATPTASGKSLCYNLPVLQRLAHEPQARALYLFPTKALSRDQEESLRRFCREAGLAQGAITYDGDTPGDARRAARENSGLLLTNPDMLHAGILPHHAAWARFFANLAYVIVDELHVYRGVFGSHVSNVLRRLRRVARFHGSAPTFIFASATIGNAQEHATRTAGRPVALVQQSGAPQGPRHIMVYNPPVVNEELGIRASYIKSAVRLALDLVRAEVPTLIFGHSRNNVEVMLKYLRDRVGAAYIDRDSIQGYRGGYLPDQRRRIEAGLRAGTVRCVVATNALELGIDIGALDAVVCAGYPGSVAGLWQRFGRGGRRGDQSLALLVTSSAPLDQYWALQPKALVGKSVEQARTDPDNVEILVQHLKCAAFELPFNSGENFGDVPAAAVADALDFLVQHRVLHPSPNGRGQTTYHWATDAYPANHVSLRQVGWDNFVIIEIDINRTIAEMDWRSAHTMLHEQAIYQHMGNQYQVERLDFDNRKAFVRAVAPDYYTDAMTHTKVTVLEEEVSAPLAGCGLAAFGDISVIEKVVGFKKVKFHTHENVGYGEVKLPEMQMHTASFWLTVSRDTVESIPWSRPEVIDGLRGVSHGMHTVAAVALMVDPRDLGRTVTDDTQESNAGQMADFDPTLFLFDRIAGGIGLARRLFEEHEALLVRTRHLVDTCPCDHGCPGCVGPLISAPGGQGGSSQKAPACGNVRKLVAQRLLAHLGVAATN